MAGEGVDMDSYYRLIRYDGNKDQFCALEMSIAAQINNFPFHIHVEGLRAEQVRPPSFELQSRFCRRSLK